MVDAGTVMDSMPVGVVTADAEGAVISTNRAARRLLGVDPATLPPQRWYDAMGLTRADGSSYSSSSDESPLHAALRGQRLHDQVIPVRPPGSPRTVWLVVYGAPLPGGGGLAVLADITERHTARLFLDALVENIPDMIFVKDAQDLRFVRFNRAGERLLGYRRDELIGRNDYDFFTREEADFFTLNDRAVLAGRRMVEIPEESIHTHESGVRVLRTKKVPVLDRDGTPLYLLGISEDITEQVRAREALAVSRARQAREQAARAAAEEAVRMRDEFLSIASHELRTPVTSLQLALQGLIRLAQEGRLEVQPPVRLLTALERAERQGRRLARLIDTLLDLSRIRAGQLQLQLAEVDLALVAGEVLRQLGGAAGLAGSSLTLDAPGAVLGHWDAARLEQVITNLVDNAIKYGAGQPVVVRVTLAGVRARLVVEDRGIGIPPDRQASIFERFERAASAEHRGGLGLGLYIVRGIVEALGGTIAVTSTPGQGSTFTVELPCEA